MQVFVLVDRFLRLISGSFAFNFLVSMATHPTCLRLLKQSKPNLGVFPSGPAISVKFIYDLLYYPIYPILVAAERMWTMPLTD